MMRWGMVAATFAALCLAGAPAQAITPKEKMVTCKFGADNQKLKGTARKSFLNKCMADTDAPTGSTKTARAKTAKNAKKPAAAVPAPPPAPPVAPMTTPAQ